MRQLFPENVFVAPKLGNGNRLVIAEAPGEDETITGEPLTGGAGRWFDNMCKKAGIRRDDLTLVNCINCRPPDNIFPTDPDAKKYISREDGEKSVQHCLNAHVRPLLTSRPWSRVDLLGEKPLRYIAGRTEGVFKWRGSPIPIPELGPEPRAIATLHPAYIMRDQEMLPAVINDLQKGLALPPEYYNLFPDLDQVKEFKFHDFAFDIETNGWTKEITMVGLSAKPYFVMVVPFRGAYVDELKRIFREANSVIGHNVLQFDIPVLEHSGVRISDKCQVWDTMLLQHLCFPSFPHDLEFVGSQFSNKPAWKDDKRNFQLYCARDVDVTIQAFKQLLPMVRQYNLERLYKNVSVPLAKICHLMQETGFKVDGANIKNVREKLLGQMRDEEKFLPEPMRTHEVPVKRRQPAPPGTLGKNKKPLKFILVPSTEEVIPWRSPAMKQKYLYGKDEPWMLGLPEQFDPKSERLTTGKNALDKLFRRTKERGLLALRNLNKWDELITTFCKEDMQHVGRMHPHFNVHGTASGRLSSSDPNLQNIPEGTRFIYVPSHAGWKVVDVDYSQIENRLTAHFAGDTERLNRFVKDPKFSEHKYAASKFMGVEYDQVEKTSDPDSPYIKAKKIVHGTNYGEGAKKIALLNDLDFAEVKRLLDIWKQEISATIAWQTRTAEQAKKDGYLTTPFGRRRWFFTSSYYTESLSFLPQSTAADIVFRAMIGLMYERINWPEQKVQELVRVYEAIPQPARLLLQVHDSLVFECPPELVDRLVRTIKKVMEQPWPELGGMSIPIGIKVGDSWGEAEDYKLPS